ncbi:MAG: transporter [Nitrospirales bacterium]|nr:MAG: transporter [Nitrospirales bacterium]
MVLTGCLRSVVITVALCSGCTTAPPQVQTPNLHSPIPDHWLAETAPGVLINQWWLTFEDPALSGFLNEALRSNHDLQAAAARITVAEAEARIAGADLWPQVNAGTDATRQRQNFAGSFGAALPGGGGNTAFIFNSFGVSLDLSWELDIWGRIRSGASAAAADLQAQKFDFAAAALSLAAQTAKTWYSLTEARLQVELAEATVLSFKKTATYATDRVNAGIQPPTDKHLSVANFASAESTLKQREETLRRTVRQLEVLLGRYPAGALSGARTLPAIEQAIPSGLPSELLRRRPDLRVTERRMAAADARVYSAQAALLPRLSLTASTGTASQDLSNILSGDFLIWTIAGNLVQPLFQGGRLRARIDQAEGQLAEAAESYAQQTLQAFSEVEIALAVESVLAQREAALGTAVQASQDAVRVAENRYAQGVEQIIVVLESQRRAFDTESAWLTVRRQRIDNRLNLHLALGDGVEELLESMGFRPLTTKGKME